MSRVHDALRRAEQAGVLNLDHGKASADPGTSLDHEGPPPVAENGAARAAFEDSTIGGLHPAILENVPEVPFQPAPESHLLDLLRSHETPAEEFRTLRTRLNHLQTLQPLHTLVITSASPAEGKSFTAANLALTQAQLADKRVLLVDFDFRRPTADKTFQVPISPGMTNYLQGTASLGDIMMRVNDSNLYLITAGDAVPNPLELLNLRECQTLISELRSHFDWVIIDSPPLLFAADGNLLSTMCDGTVLVVRIGTTTFDSVTRALQSLCENNVLGIVVNGARRGELYSKYTYYHDYYAYGDDREPDPDAASVEDEYVEAEN